MKTKNITACIKNVKCADIIDFLEGEDIHSYTLTLTKYNRTTSCIFFETNSDTERCKKILKEKFGLNIQF